jgi:hypothetical protein
MKGEGGKGDDRTMYGNGVKGFFVVDVVRPYLSDVVRRTTRDDKKKKKDDT